MSVDAAVTLSCPAKVNLALSVGPADPARGELLRTEDLKVWFPIQRGFLRRTTGYVWKLRCAMSRW